MEFDTTKVDTVDWTDDDFEVAAELGDLVREANHKEASDYIKKILEEG